MKLALFSCQKGSGKTTLAVNLASIAASQGNRTLLLDADPEGSLHDLVDLSESGIALDKKGKMILRHTSQSNLTVLCGFGSALSHAPEKVVDVLNKVTKREGEFDLCIYDCSSTSKHTFSHILNGIDRIIIPTVPGETALKDFEDTIEELVSWKRLNVEPYIAGVIHNKADEQSTRKFFLNQVFEKFPELNTGLDIPVNDLLNQGEEIVPASIKEPNSQVSSLLEKLLTVAIAPERVASDLPIGQIDMMETLIESEGSEARAEGGAAGSDGTSKTEKAGVVSGMLNWMKNLFG